MSNPQITQEENLEGIPEPGDIIGSKYEVDGIIGVGGMGVVLAGTHLHLQQPVAIKILLPDFLQNQDIRGRFLREARSAARLRSDHITRIYDVGALENGLPHMVMERLEGINLADSLQEDGALDVPNAVGYLLQTCEAVAEAHAAGIVHRDLKPANLFLASKPNGSVVIKVLDFGISKSVEDGSRSNPGVPSLTGPHSLLGSPHYMSPEQIRDSSEVDSRTDVWALGVLLFELLTQRMPFEAMSLPHLYARILSETPTHPREYGFDIPEPLVDIIMDCLVKSRDDRIQDVGMLAERLAAFGPPWAAASVDHVRHALERRSEVMSRPPLAPVSSAPTPTRFGENTTLAVTGLRELAGRSASRRWMLAGASLAVVLGLGAAAAWLSLPMGDSEASRQQAGTMLAGLTTAHQLTAQQVELRLSAPDVQPVRVEEEATDESTANIDEAVREPKRSAGSLAQPPSPPRSRAKSNKSAGPKPVRDLRSITLID